jgi:hypothetical protein
MEQTAHWFRLLADRSRNLAHRFEEEKKHRLIAAPRFALGITPLVLLGGVRHVPPGVTH